MKLSLQLLTAWNYLMYKCILIYLFMTVMALNVVAGTPPPATGAGMAKDPGGDFARRHSI